MQRNLILKILMPQLLFGAAVICFTVSCSSTPEKFSLPHQSKDDWSNVVDKSISDKERAFTVKNLGYELINMTDSLQIEIDKLNTKAAALNERYDTSDEEMLKVFEEFTVIRNQTFARYRDLIFAMRSEVSAEEWEEITD